MSKPKDIYKFRMMSINSLSSISSSKIWFSSKKNLNDPFEGYVNVVAPKNEREKVAQYIDLGKSIVQKQSGLAPAQVERVIMERYLSSPDEFMDFVENSISEHERSLIEYQEKLGIFSTSSDIPGNPQTQVANMLMWSHYGDEFKGFCIKYDHRKLYESLQQLNSGVKFAWCKVNYIKTPHSVNFLDSLSDDTLDFLKSIQYKHEQWEYECEIRVVANETGLFSYSPEAITGVYIGEKMPEEQKELLITVVSKTLPNCDIFSVSMAKNTTEYTIQTNKI
jgi:hypothetical protein